MGRGICPWCGRKVDKLIMFRGDIVGCRYCGIHTKQTNADKIRSMSDEELADMLDDKAYPFKVWEGLSVGAFETSYDAWLWWLIQEVE